MPTHNPLTPTLRRALRGICGRRGWENYANPTYALLGDMLEQRGLVRTVKHRDHTRTFALTPAGRALHKAESARRTSRRPPKDPPC